MSDEAAPEVLTESVQTTMENTTPTDASVSDISSIIPAEYADKGWVKDVKDINGLFKLTDGLKSEMGKRPGGIPQETASDEDKAAFYTELGVPESGEAYDLGEGDAEYQKGIRDLFHKANITEAQAKMLAEGNAEIIKGLTPDAAAQDAAFDKIAADTFGERREEVLSTAKLLLAENVKDLSPEMQEHVNNLPNKELIVMASVLDKIKEKYINEDSLPASNQAKAATAEDSRKKGYELMQSPAWTDRSHPDHARVAAEVAKIYGT